MAGIVCDRNYSFLDVKEFKFRWENNILVSDVIDHFANCASCSERLEHLTTEDLQDMKSYYARFEELQKSAPAEVVQETREKIMSIIIPRR